MLPVIIGFVLILAGVQSFIRRRPQVQTGARIRMGEALMTVPRF